MSNFGEHLENLLGDEKDQILQICLYLLKNKKNDDGTKLGKELLEKHIELHDFLFQEGLLPEEESSE